MIDHQTDPNSHDFDFDSLQMSDKAKQTIADDPEMATAFREAFALIGRANQAWRSGQYPDFGSAARALGLIRNPLEKIRRERRSAEAHASELLTALRGVLNFPHDLDVHRHAIELINQVIREACEVEF